ncbi:hypothetical protein KKG45_05735 [bacterium]|nr:hypothetical protein [bacterium]
MKPGTDLASRLVVGLAGPRLEAVEREWLARHRPAGVILYRRNVRSAAQAQELCGLLREILPPGAEIMADHEGGPVSVLDAAAGRPPAPWTLGLIDDPQLTRDVARDAAVRARAVGVDRLLAPCMDVLTAPDNPIIGSRAFAADPGRVARHVAAAVAGIADAGLRCCLKHWPGHGGTGVDTHLAAAGRVVPDDPAVLRAGLAAGADAVMLGHLRLFDDDLPASISPIAVEVLRGESGGALLFSDDLTMGALRGPLGALAGAAPAGTGLCDPASLTRAWFAAAARGGCDILLCRGIPWTAWPLAGQRSDDLPRLGADLDPPVASSALPLAPPPSWSAAIGRAAVPCLDDTRSDLLCWHASPAHRWGRLRDDDIRAAGWQSGVHDLVRGAEPEAAQRYAQFLIASHAPLRDEAAQAVTARLTRVLNRSGTCLTLGHPSLPAAAARLLPATWRIEAGFDLTGATLSGFIVPRRRA